MFSSMPISAVTPLLKQTLLFGEQGWLFIALYLEGDIWTLPALPQSSTLAQLYRFTL